MVGDEVFRGGFVAEGWVVEVSRGTAVGGKWVGVPLPDPGHEDLEVCQKRDEPWSSPPYSVWTRP